MLKLTPSPRVTRARSSPESTRLFLPVFWITQLSLLLVPFVHEFLCLMFPLSERIQMVLPGLLPGLLYEHGWREAVIERCELVTSCIVVV